MNKDKSKLKEIDNYLSGELDAQHLADFEKRILEEDDLQKEIELTKQVIDGIEGHAFKLMLKRIHEKHFGNASKSDLEKQDGAQ